MCIYDLIIHGLGSCHTCLRIGRCYTAICEAHPVFAFSPSAFWVFAQLPALVISAQRAERATGRRANGLRENHPHIHPRRDVLIHAHPQGGAALGLEQIVEDAHLRFIVGAAYDLIRAIAR